MRAKRGSASPQQAGFTLVEVMLSILLSSIAMIGLTALYLAETRASGFSRHMTEASVLAQDKVERLRTDKAETVADSETGIDASGAQVTGGLFTRAWAVVSNGAFLDVTVTVSWPEDAYTRQVIVRARRNL